MLRNDSWLLTGIALAALAVACAERPASDGAGDSAAVAAADSVGEELYASICAACHAEDGNGLSAVYPPLAGSEVALGAVPTLIRIVVGGLEGPITVKGEQYNSTMLPYGGGPELDDSEVAAVLSYVRTSFGNSASRVTADEVARERAATAGRVALWTPAELGLR